MKLEQRRISPRMGLPKFTICKGDAPSERGYHNEQSGLLPPSSTSVEETQKAPAQKEQQQQAGRQAEGVRQGRSQRYLVRALDGMPVEGRAPRLVRGLLKKLMNKMAEYYAKERGGVGWRWQAMDSKHSPAPLGGEKTGKNPTDRGKLGAKMNLLVDRRGAPISVVLTGANRHDKISAIDLIVSMIPKRPAHKEQHL